MTFRRAPGLVQIFGVISAALLGAGVFCLGAAVLPRIGMAIEGRARYFMDHAQYTDLDHLRRSVEREASDPAGRHLEQLSALSGVVKTKYRLTQAGEILIGLALVSVMSTGLLNYLMS